MHFRVRKERGHVVHCIVRAIALVGLTATLLVRKLIPWFNVEFLVNEQTPFRLTGSLDDLIDITRGVLHSVSLQHLAHVGTRRQLGIGQ